MPICILGRFDALPRKKSQKSDSWLDRASSELSAKRSKMFESTCWLNMLLANVLYYLTICTLYANVHPVHQNAPSLSICTLSTKMLPVFELASKTGCLSICGQDVQLSVNSLNSLKTIRNFLRFCTEFQTRHSSWWTVLTSKPNARTTNRMSQLDGKL